MNTTTDTKMTVTIARSRTGVTHKTPAKFSSVAHCNTRSMVLTGHRNVNADSLQILADSGAKFCEKCFDGGAAAYIAFMNDRDNN